MCVRVASAFASGIAGADGERAIHVKASLCECDACQLKYILEDDGVRYTVSGRIAEGCRATWAAA